MSEGSPRALYAPERHAAILAVARAHGRVEVAALADELGVTAETVRRDLTSLERLGMLRRVHGGALLINRDEGEPTLTERLGKLADEKHRIAVRALQEVPDNGTILLDSGTTTMALAALLVAERPLTVVTNSVSIANVLRSRAGLELYLLGGRVRRITGAAVGAWVASGLADLSVDVAFMGTNGCTPERGLTTPDQDEAAAKRAMVGSARRVVVLTDSSKVGRDTLHRFAAPEEVAMLITDTGLDEDVASTLDLAGMDVVRV